MILAGIVAAAAVTGAQASPRDASQEASIPFANHGGIRDFHADGRDAVFLQGTGRQWYRAELMGPCLDLPWANAIGVETRGTSSLDRFGTLIVRGQRCPIASLTRSAPPNPARPPASRPAAST